MKSSVVCGCSRSTPTGQQAKGAVVPAHSCDASAPPSSCMNCPHCGLTIRANDQRLAIEYCPRCIVHSRKAVRLFATTLPTVELYASDAILDAARPDRPAAAVRSL